MKPSSRKRPIALLTLLGLTSGNAARSSGIEIPRCSMIMRECVPQACRPGYSMRRSVSRRALVASAEIPGDGANGNSPPGGGAAPSSWLPLACEPLSNGDLHGRHLGGDGVACFHRFVAVFAVMAPQRRAHGSYTLASSPQAQQVDGCFVLPSLDPCGPGRHPSRPKRDFSASQLPWLEC